MQFDGAPSFLLSEEVRARRYDEGRTVAIRGRDGTRDEIYVPAGHWAIRDAGGVYELSDEDFVRRFVAVPPDPASFADRGRPVRAVAARGAVAVEGRGMPMPRAEFDAAAVRLTRTGRPLCRVSAAFALQAGLLAKAGAEGAEHLADLRARAESLRSGILADPALAADLSMMDAVLSTSRDGLSDGMAQIHAARPPEGVRVVETADAGDEEVYGLDPDSVRGRIVAGLGVHPSAVLDVVHSPLYGTSQFRAFARVGLSPYLGGRALEDVLAVSTPAGEAGREAREAVRAWLRGAELVAEGPEIEIPEMPGYRTSEVGHYRFEGGLDVLAFSDVYGNYLYAWRTMAPPAPRP